MIKINVSDKRFSEVSAQGRVYFIEHEKPFDQIKAEATTFFPSVDEVFAVQKFTGAAGSSVVVPGTADDNLIHLIFVGLGEEHDGKLSMETYRRALGSVVRSAEKHKLSSLAFNIPSEERFKVSPEDLARETVITLNMADYHFDQYITDESKKTSDKTIECTLVIIGENKSAFSKGVAAGEIIAKAQTKARTWVDMPPSALPPAEFAKNAQHIAQEVGLNITVFSEEEVKKMGMGGLAGVSAGSEQDCKLVIMEYKAAKKDAPRIGIVGKGITFDSGGLSLKPPVHMVTMKEDMSGAAAALATMEAIGQLKPDVNVVAVMPLAENLPSGTATKPGDIVRFYNGKTAEVRDTDAEGRLILADALSYAVKHYKLDALIDLATLTGACAHALGPFFAGMMGKHEDLLDRVQTSASRSGDRAWRLPFDDDYKDAIKSPIADICNIGSSKYMAGAITAGFFLSNFTGDVPWVHLDIAGVAYNVPDMSYFRPGATGYGVRLLTDLITHW